MKLYRVLCIITLLIGWFAPCNGLFGDASLQDYIDSFIDAAKFKLDGTFNLNESAVGEIWTFFKTKYSRVYSSLEEERARLRVFADHLRYVLKSNLKKITSFQLELNEFADWTLQEFNDFKKGLINSLGSQRDFINEDDDVDDSFRRSLKQLYQRHYHLKRLKRSLNRRRFKNRGFRDWFWGIFKGNKNKTQPNNILDWRTKSAVSSVKNQLKCGACYAFATATIMETLYAMKTNSKTAIDFSSQQIADCSSNGNNGCSGGNFIPSIQYLMANGGKIATEASYPFAGARKTCRTSDINEISLGNIEYGGIPQGDETKLAEALATYGPIFIGIDADSRRFMFYKAGVLSIANCPTRPHEMDHAMVVVGHGYDEILKVPYWIIKNSWGTKWGENGYLRLIKDAGNMCGVATMAYYARLT